MKAVIVQSSFMPWMGFFHLIEISDVFVFYDDVQYTIRDWRNRNRIRTQKQWIWLSVPVKLERPHFEYRICEVPISYDHKWVKKHLNSIINSYQRSAYFDEFFPIIQGIDNKRPDYLSTLNYEIILAICDYLGINKPQFIFSQDMDIPKEHAKTDRLLAVLERIGGVKTFISGPKAKSYLETNKFTEKGINVVWHDYQQPYYEQNLWGSNIFISNMSIIDLIFNHGKESMQILTRKKVIEKPKLIEIVSPEKALNYE